MSNITNKKKIMFITNEDYNFLTYNLLILLDVFDAEKSDNAFHDYRKIAFLIDFVANSNLIRLISESSHKINISDKEYLSKIYSDSYVRQSQITKLIFFLEKQDLIAIGRGKKSDTIDLWLNKDISSGFYNKDIFLNEYKNAVSLKTIIPRLKILSLATLKERLFYNFGVKKWQI